MAEGLNRTTVFQTENVKRNWSEPSFRKFSHPQECFIRSIMGVRWSRTSFRNVIESQKVNLYYTCT